MSLESKNIISQTRENSIAHIKIRTPLANEYLFSVKNASKVTIKREQLVNDLRIML